MHRIKNRPVWRIATTVPAEAEEAVIELFGRIFSRAPAAYVDFEARLATIALYCDKKPRLSAAIRAELAQGFNHIRQCGLEVGHPKLSVRKLAQQDWAESWKKHFHPLEIGSALLIKPSWSKQRPKKGQKTIILDPGLSFGTGQHPTTEYCLRELERRRGEDPPSSTAFVKTTTSAKKALRRGEDPAPYRSLSFLDVGTGSGILAIAAARLGYAPIDALDFDPEAVRVASANAQRNRVLRRIHLLEQDVSKLSADSKSTGMSPLRAAKYSVICANLISNLLIEARDRFVARLSQDGVIIVAGILRNEFEEVQRAYEEAGLELVKCGVKKEWRSGTFAWRER